MSVIQGVARLTVNFFDVIIAQKALWGESGKAHRWRSTLCLREFCKRLVRLTNLPF